MHNEYIHKNKIHTGHHDNVSQCKFNDALMHRLHILCLSHAILHFHTENTDVLGSLAEPIVVKIIGFQLFYLFKLEPIQNENIFSSPNPTSQGLVLK